MDDSQCRRSSQQCDLKTTYVTTHIMYTTLCSQSSSTSLGSNSSSSNSLLSLSSLDLSDDASSSFRSSGPLYELLDLKAHIPTKKGLSRYYQGKSESFTSLSNVKCKEDLAKKETQKKRSNRLSCKHKGVIAKKAIRGSCLHKSHSLP